MYDAALTVDGRSYSGWKTVKISRSIETISAKFSLSVSERWPGEQAGQPIKPGAACRLSIPSIKQTVIIGHVDRVAPSYTSDDHSVIVEGRDLAGDLVDCSATNEPGEWRHRTLVQIVSDIAAPFGIPVEDLAGITEKFIRFRLEEGETAFEAIERACRARAALPVMSEGGTLELIRATMHNRATESLQHGVNILEGSADYDHRDRYSIYQVKSQAPGYILSDPEVTSRVKASASDPVISRFRPMVMLAEHASTADRAAERATWEANVRAARARTVKIVKQGWMQANGGGLWRPNLVVPVIDDWLDIESEMHITGVTLSYEGQGYRAILTLRPLGAFTPEPVQSPDGVPSWMS
jgi:prophage tail gpP-like protein